MNWLSCLAAKRMEDLASGEAKWIRRRSVKYRYMVLLCAPMMSKALGLVEGTLQCSNIEFRTANGGIDRMLQEK
ncbi:hypothetical protein J1N35_018633 [Gossypium stocksii]|uniref:Uncharacterized protein n=1 Tax=Gossypium stocksii TaxID=47602 RepID=A0A9D4A7E5_9ROSI|nr:hypothetical protein J1N35_018633 [Gossypium stocksii]